MAGKGIIKFFLVVLTLFCSLQYFYMYPTYKVENAAKEFAMTKAANAPAEMVNSLNGIGVNPAIATAQASHF